MVRELKYGMKNMSWPDSLKRHPFDNDPRIIRRDEMSPKTRLYRWGINELIVDLEDGNHIRVYYDD